MKNNLKGFLNTSLLDLLLVITITIMFIGCLSIKPASTNSGKKYFETFYIGEEGTQYFVKPILLKNNQSKEDMLLDITFRYKNEIKDSATLNFSIRSSIIYKKIDSLELSNKVTGVKCATAVLLYNEKNKTGFTSRYSTKISLKEIKEMFSNSDWYLTIYSQNKSTKYQPEKKSINAINSIRDNIFVLM